MPAQGALSGNGPIELIETLRWSPAEGFVRLDRHLRRLAASAEAFGIPFRVGEVMARLARSVAGEHALRIRLILVRDGTIGCEIARLHIKQEWHCALSPHLVQSSDPLLQHKTNRRDLFLREQARVAALGLHEVIFLNERGEVTQGSRSNVFARVGVGLVTPPLHCGLLNGCLRQELIEAGACAETVLFPADLIAAEEFYFGNSLRGLVRARLSPSQQ